jgi:hypothetical protein
MSLLALPATGTGVIRGPVAIAKALLVLEVRLRCHLEVQAATGGLKSRHSRSISAMVSILRSSLTNKV